MRPLRLRSCAFLAALLVPGAGSRSVDAAVLFIVNSQLDAPDQTPGDGVCATAAATCTLRAAVQEAGFQTSNDVVILVPAGVYRLTLASTGGGPCPDTDTTGDLDLKNYHARTITIGGQSPEATVIDGNGLDGVFDISAAAGSTTALLNLTIRGGKRSKSCYSFGGGVHTFSTAGSPGTVTITNCVISDNSAQSGGGVFNEGSTVTMVKTVVQNNRASNMFPKVSAGGGIENFSGSLTVDRSTISGNRAETGSSANKTDGAGGGVGIFDGPVAITNSTISGNTAYGDGGGIEVSGVIGATVQLANVTITANTADGDNNGVGDGGGIADDSATLTVKNSIVAGNADPGGQGIDCAANAPGALAVSYAIIPSPQTCTARFMPAPVGLLNVSPNPLSPLQANGGGAPTHDLLAGSPARDAGDPAGCGVPTDERGVARPQGARCDLGVVEAGAPDTDGDRVPDPIDDCVNAPNLDRRDSDGDGIGDVCDNCPAVANPSQSASSCLAGSTASTTIDSGGGTLVAGNVKISVPPGALGGQPGCVATNCPTSFSATGLADSEWKLGTAATGSGLYLAVKLFPENVTFNTPVTLTFSWPDVMIPAGIIDGTSIPEATLRIFQNGNPITNTCSAQPCGTVPCCNAGFNTFTVQVTSFSEFAVARDGACALEAMTGADLKLTRLAPPPTDDGLALTGVVALAKGKTIADVATKSGLGIVLGDAATGVVAGATLPAGKFDPTTKRGWKMKPNGLSRYVDNSATPPAGIRRVVLAPKGVGGDGRALAALRVRGQGVSYRADRTAQATVTLDPNDGPCFTTRFPGPPGPQCRIKNGGATLRCR